jgi:hypothetical protein
MRYIVAFVTSLLLIVGMFVFAEIMSRWEQSFVGKGVMLPDYLIFLISLQHLIWKFWFVLATIIVAFCFFLAYLLSIFTTHNQ